METAVQNNDEIEIDLVDLIRQIWRNKGIIILSALTLGLIVVLFGKLFLTPEFASTTKMYVLAKQENATPTNGDLQASTMLTKDYAELIKSRDVTETVISELGLNMTSEQLLDKMEISTPADTRVLAIKITDPDPYKAREIADAVRNVAAEHIQKVMNIEAVNVVEQANIPKNPQGPNVTKNGIVGALLGAIVAIAVVLVIYMTNDTIKTSDDVEKYLNLSTLGVIPLAEDEPKSKKRKIKKNKKNKKRNGGRGR